MRYLICALVLMAAGCGVQPPIEGRMDPYGPKQIYFATPELANFTTVGLPVMERKNGILYVNVPIRSTALYDLRIDYRITFFNSQGGVIYQGGWEGGKKLVTNVQDFITFNSMTGDAADFQLGLKYSQ